MIRFTTPAHADAPTFTIQFAARPAVPHLERLLLDYFERAVAAGTTFRAGQTIQLGWSMLRLCDRDDGTLGVEERALSPTVSWTEAVDRALRDLWMQREVARSVALADELDFPRQDHSLMLAPCADGGGSVLMSRLDGDELPDDFSGWTLTCTADHDHGERSFLPLLGLAAVQPGLVQFLALPPGVTVLVSWDPRLRPTVFRAGEERTPTSGSYLAALRDAR
jgi:hypothetical protein